MKAKHVSFIVGAIMLMVLSYYTYSFCEQKEVNNTNTELASLSAEELFVPIHADTLDRYLKKYFNKGGLLTNKKSNEYVIEYNPNAYILLHANGNKMTEIRQTLENTPRNDFSIKKGKEKVKITMRKNGDYVDCPALIVTEILRKMNDI